MKSLVFTGVLFQKISVSTIKSNISECHSIVGDPIAASVIEEKYLWWPARIKLPSSLPTLVKTSTKVTITKNVSASYVYVLVHLPMLVASYVYVLVHLPILTECWLYNTHCTHKGNKISAVNVVKNVGFRWIRLIQVSQPSQSADITDYQVHNFVAINFTGTCGQKWIHLLLPNVYIK